MAAGEISYVGGATNRWVYRDNVGNKNIANFLNGSNLSNNNFKATSKILLANITLFLANSKKN